MAHEDAELEETRVLLADFRKLGFKAPITQIAKIIDVNPSTVSAYGKPRKGGKKAHPMPLRHRMTLRAFLDSRKEPAGGRRLSDRAEPAYPSQRVARAHELIEELGRVTQADDPVWIMVIRSIETALSTAIPKEPPPDTRLAATNPISERRDLWPSTNDGTVNPTPSSTNLTLRERRIRQVPILVERRH